MNTNQQKPMRITETSRSAGQQALGSRSQCHAKTSHWLLESLLSLSVCASLLVCLVLALTSSSQLYEVYQSLPVSNQFAIVFAISMFTFGYAVTVREFRTEWGEQWVGRIAGIAGIFFISAFAYRMTLTVERLQDQLTVEKTHHAAEAHQMATFQKSTEPAAVVWSVLPELRERSYEFTATDGSRLTWKSKRPRPTSGFVGSGMPDAAGRGEQCSAKPRIAFVLGVLLCHLFGWMMFPTGQ